MTWVHDWREDSSPQKDDESIPELPAPLAPPRRVQFGLRHIMILSVIVAVVIASITTAIRSGQDSDKIIAFLTVSLAFMGCGFFLTQRLVRWAVLGWIAILLSLTMISLVLTGYLTLLILPVVIGGIIFLVGRRRAAHQEALVWVLALAAERKRPLGPAVLAHAHQIKGIHRVRAERLAECLDHGMPLPDSLDFVNKAVSAPARVLARVGHDSGELAEALRDAAESRSAQPAGWQSFGAKIGYLFMVLAVLQIITGFMLYFITPKYEAVFKDFGIDLPQITIWTILISHWMANTYVLPVVSTFELLFLLYIPFAFSGYGNLKVPFIDRIFIRRHSVLVFRCLAMIVKGEKPISLGLQILARWYPTTWVRERLAGAYLATNHGVDWIEALRRSRLASRSDAALLDAARRAGNLGWALRELAEGSARKLGYRLQIVNQIVLSVVLIAVAGLVGLFAVSYFLPLVMLIRRLA